MRCPSRHNGGVTSSSRAAPRTWAVPILIVLVGTVPLAYAFLLSPDSGHWMVDLRVYREAGISLLDGRAVYDHVTPPPQELPFTYPPFAALLAIPLAWVPFTVLGWIWFYAQLVAIVVTVRIAAAPLLARVERHGVVWGLLALAITYTLPVTDGLRFGQVNAFLVLAVLIDVARPDLVRRIRLPGGFPLHGVLVGLATAIKLTPGVFIIYFLVTRQWRAAATSIVTVAVSIVGVLLIAPRLSLDFWTDALFASDRLGHNDGTANQSIRAVILRVGPEGTLGTLLLLGLIAVVVIIGYAAAKRAYDHHELLLAFTLVAMVGVLVSPVSWSHHFHWLLPGVCWLVARGFVTRDRRVIAAGAAVWLILTLHITWWAHWRLMGNGHAVFDRHLATGNPLWAVPHNALALVGLLTLFGLARMAWTTPKVEDRQRSAPTPSRR